MRRLREEIEFHSLQQRLVKDPSASDTKFCLGRWDNELLSRLITHYFYVFHGIDTTHVIMNATQNQYQLTLH